MIFKKTMSCLALLLATIQLAVSAEEIPEYRERYENLPYQTRLEFRKNVAESQRMFSQKRIIESLDYLAKADKILPDYPAVMSIQGACYVEFRDFDQASEIFKKVHKIQPKNFGVAFNIGEVYFVTGKWKEAKEYFLKVLEGAKGMKTSQTYYLSEFKVYICNKKLGLEEESSKMEAKYDYRTDSPVYYYVNSVKEISAENDSQGQLWLLRAQSVFRNAAVTEPWQDSMIEAGYLDSFYGGQNAEGGAISPLKSAPVGTPTGS